MSITIGDRVFHSFEELNNYLDTQRKISSRQEKWNWIKRRALGRFWEIVHGIEDRWARARYGYSTRDLYDTGGYLIELICKMTEELLMRDKYLGVADPEEYSEFRTDLIDMVMHIQVYRNYCDSNSLNSTREEAHVHLDRGMELFKQHVTKMWN